MTSEEWAKITDLFGDALELTPADRLGLVDRLRAEDPASAAEVSSLLEVHDRPGEFLPDLPTPIQLHADLGGRTIGAYRLTRPLGSGGMGTVYLGERSDGSFSKQVAVKLLSLPFVDARDRFHRERELLAQLDHPNIARLIDGGATAEGWPYLVMEYVEGVPIDRYCAERDVPLDNQLRLLLQVCAGVAHAHQRLIIHCDIKPANILVSPDGTVKLLDFGIGKLIEFAGTTTQYRPATPTYSSPEQLQGDPLTTACDVYSIGVLAYVLLTGSWPYPTRSGRLMEAVQAVLNAEPMVASRAPDVPPARARRMRGDLDNVLAKAVAKDPNRRYASAQQLADDLEAFGRGFPVRARADTVLYRLRKLVDRHRFATAAVAAGTASLIAAVTVSMWQARVAERRFEDLRELAHAVVFDVDDSLVTVPGTTAARKLVVETALRYLDRLSQERSFDPALREEVAAAYIRVGKVQGGAFLPNLGDTTGAVTSFGKALAAIGQAPAIPALERLRIEAHINTGLLATDPIQGAPDFERAIAAGEQQLARDPQDVPILRLIAQAQHGEATIAHVTNRAVDHLRIVTRAVALRERVLKLSPESWQDQVDLAREYAQLALALVQNGDPAAALTELQRARSVLDAAYQRLPSNQFVARGLAENGSRKAAVLLSLGRIPDALAELATAINLLEPLVASDAHNLQYKADLAYAWFQLGDVRRAQGQLTDALDLHRRALGVRGERAARDSAFMFVPWEHARSLNTVGELLLEISPDNWKEARQLFEQAQDIAERTLSVAPSFNEIRKQLATSYEGLAQASIAQVGYQGSDVYLLLDKSLATWREAIARSEGDRRHNERLERVERLVVTLRPIR